MNMLQKKTVSPLCCEKTVFVVMKQLLVCEGVPSFSIPLF